MRVKYNCRRCNFTNFLSVIAETKFDIYSENKGKKYFVRFCKNCKKENRVEINELIAVKSIFQKTFLTLLLLSLVIFIIVYIEKLRSIPLGKFTSYIEIFFGGIVVFIGILAVSNFEFNKRINIFNKSKL